MTAGPRIWRARLEPKQLRFTDQLKASASTDIYRTTLSLLRNEQSVAVVAIACRNATGNKHGARVARSVAMNFIAHSPKRFLRWREAYLVNHHPLSSIHYPPH